MKLNLSPRKSQNLLGEGSLTVRYRLSKAKTSRGSEFGLRDFRAFYFPDSEMSPGLGNSIAKGITTDFERSVGSPTFNVTSRIPHTLDDLEKKESAIKEQDQKNDPKIPQTERGIEARIQSKTSLKIIGLELPKKMKSVPLCIVKDRLLSDRLISMESANSPLSKKSIIEGSMSSPRMRAHRNVIKIGSVPKIDIKNSVEDPKVRDNASPDNMSIGELTSRMLAQNKGRYRIRSLPKKLSKYSLPDKPLLFSKMVGPGHFKLIKD
jgi:hypothetical protein